MIEITEIEAPNPPELWEILEKHGMISHAIAQNPMLVGGMCGRGQFYVWHEDGAALALQMEFIGVDPQVLDIAIIPDDRWLGKRKVEISQLQPMLRDRWFPHFRRIQSSVPASRVNIHRIMKSLGFTEETRRDIGVRNGIRLGRKVEGLVLYGLLPDDPLRFRTEQVEHDHVS